MATRYPSRRLPRYRDTQPDARTDTTRATVVAPAEGSPPTVASADVTTAVYRDRFGGQTIAQALGLVALVLLFVFAAALLLAPGNNNAPADPGVVIASPGAFEARPPSPSMRGATASPAPSPTPAPTSRATPTLEPTARPTPEPTPRPTARPTPVVTPRPEISPAAAAVLDFYNAVTVHDWETAIALWSPSMQERYPPQEYLIDRFARTTEIDITRLRTISMDADAGRARVAVSLVEHRSIEPSPRTFVGAWDLVLVDGRWLLNDPDF
jgi:hypothetical protein